MIRRRFGMAALLLFGFVLGGMLRPFQWIPTFAQADCRSFPETGKQVCGRFLEYWTNNGGLAQQGLPLTNEFTEVSDLNGQSYTVQYFERAVFEKHPENAPPFDVLLSQLGTFRMQSKYPHGAPEQSGGTTPPQTGAIEGDVGYPASGVPASYIVAIEVGGGRSYYTRTDNSLGVKPYYRIDNIAPGIYNVVARPVTPLPGADPLCGGYSQYVACGQSISCYDHSLVPITVGPGQTVTGIDVEDWYGTAYCYLTDYLHLP